MTEQNIGINMSLLWSPRTSVTANTQQNPEKANIAKKQQNKTSLV